MCREHGTIYIDQFFRPIPQPLTCHSLAEAHRDGTPDGLWNMPNELNRLTLFPFQHRHILGSPGTGKRILMMHLIIDRINSGDGLMVLDFNGDFINQLIPYIQPRRINDVVLFDPSKKTVSPLNIFDSDESIPRIANLTVDMFREFGKFDASTSTPVFDRFVLYSALALLERKDSTLLEIKYMLSSASFREKVIKGIKDPIVKEFWEEDFPRLKDPFEKAQSVLNKLDMVIGDYRIRHIVSYPKSLIDFKDIRASKRILLVKLAQRDFGLEGAKLLGRLVLGNFATTANRNKQHFHVFITDAQNMQGYILQEMLVGLGRQNISLTLSNNSLTQFQPETRDAVLGNCGNKIIFRVGVEDVNYMKNIFPIRGEYSVSFDLPELPTERARCQIPAASDTFQLLVPPLEWLTYPGNARKVTALANQQYRLNAARVRKHIEGVRNES